MRHKDLQAITASIFYLATEAARADLPEVSAMLRRVIGEIEALLKAAYAAPGGPPEAADSDLLTMLELLRKVPVEDKLALEEILDALDSCEEVPGTLH